MSGVEKDFTPQNDVQYLALCNEILSAIRLYFDVVWIGLPTAGKADTWRRRLAKFGFRMEWFHFHGFWV